MTQLNIYRDIGVTEIPNQHHDASWLDSQKRAEFDAFFKAIPATTGTNISMDELNRMTLETILRVDIEESNKS